MSRCAAIRGCWDETAVAALLHTAHVRCLFLSGRLHERRQRRRRRCHFHRRRTRRDREARLHRPAHRSHRFATHRPARHRERSQLSASLLNDDLTATSLLASSVIISDTSPLSALAEIGELDILRRLYGRVAIPNSVVPECPHPHNPPALAAALRAADGIFDMVPDPVLLPEAASVDPAEAAAISLAWRHRTVSTLLIDDRDGREWRESLGLRKAGTVGVLYEAASAACLILTWSWRG